MRVCPVLADPVELLLPLEHEPAVVGDEPLLLPPADHRGGDAEHGAAEADVATARRKRLGHR